MYLEDPPQAAPDMSVAQGAHASALYYVPTAAGHGPMYAYPVQYPDGRILYHILPPQVAPSLGLLVSEQPWGCLCLHMAHLQKC